eukprot:187496-Pleurochrysis_carterae.AAC.2
MRRLPPFRPLQSSGFARAAISRQLGSRNQRHRHHSRRRRRRAARRQRTPPHGAPLAPAPPRHPRRAAERTCTDRLVSAGMERTGQDAANGLALLERLWESRVAEDHAGCLTTHFCKQPTGQQA